jgi:MarR family transcriptional regulator, transcriptional regulator for hemolysin
MPRPAHNSAAAVAARAELEASFIAALGPLRQKLRRSIDRELTGFGLSRALASPLLRISCNDGIRQCELAEQLDIEPPSLVRLIDQLAANDLVVRRPDTSDQRARTLHLTASGRALARRVMPVLQRHVSQILSGTSDAEIRTCLRTFARLLVASGDDSSAVAPK